jgi:hypothetical protein
MQKMETNRGRLASPLPPPVRPARVPVARFRTDYREDATNGRQLVRRAALSQIGLSTRQERACAGALLVGAGGVVAWRGQLARGMMVFVARAIVSVAAAGLCAGGRLLLGWGCRVGVRMVRAAPQQGVPQHQAGRQVGNQCVHKCAGPRQTRSATEGEHSHDDPRLRVGLVFGVHQVPGKSLSGLTQGSSKTRMGKPRRCNPHNANNPPALAISYHLDTL